MESIDNPASELEDGFLCPKHCLLCAEHHFPGETPKDTLVFIFALLPFTAIILANSFHSVGFCWKIKSN